MRQFYAIEVFSERAKIYGIRNKKTKRIYIGRSKNVEERIRNHLYALRNGKHSNELMQKDFDAYGEKSFEFVEICDADKRTFMFFDTENRNKAVFSISEDNRWKECYWMQHFHTFDQKYGYNYKDTYSKCKRTFESFKKVTI